MPKLHSKEGILALKRIDVCVTFCNGLNLFVGSIHADTVGLMSQQQNSIPSTPMAHQKALQRCARPMVATWQSCPTLRGAS